MEMNQFLEEMDQRFDVLWSHQQRKKLWQIEVHPKQLKPMLTYLRTSTGFVQLNHLSAVDWLEENLFQLTYLMTDPHAHISVMVIIKIDRENPVAESVHEIWPVAITYEQEINEGFGIKFPGSPRQGIPFALDDGWNELPPMRRDFDTLEYVEREMGFKSGRKHTDPKTRVAKAAKQKGYLHD